MSGSFDLNDINNEPSKNNLTTGNDISWLSELNPEQLASVRETEGPLLVLSGAGTGKTRVLTTRIAYILHNKLARPWQVLAVTFTNRAANEMRARIIDLVGSFAEQIWLGTFHSLGARILRKHCELVGLEKDFTIIDSDDQLRLLKKIIEESDDNQLECPPKILMNWIQRQKDKGLKPEQVSEGGVGELDADFGIRIYKLYQEKLEKLNCVDFGDLLLHCITIFNKFPDILSEYQNKFKYILVDEYQDTNVSQYLWLRLLSQKYNNLCCVGDDDQSIYSWRGAEVANILRFEKDFLNSKIIRLERNYRSTPIILAAASKLISYNKSRLGKNLKTAFEISEDSGDPILHRSVWDGHQEAQWVAAEISNLQLNGSSISSIAILVRAGFQTLEFEEVLVNIGIPYRVIGGPRFYERQEIRDAIAYLRCVFTNKDDLAFERIVNKPKRGIGSSSIQRIQSYSRLSGIGLMESAQIILGTDELRPKAKSSLRKFLDSLRRWRSLINQLKLSDLSAQILEESGYNEMWKYDKSVESLGRIENLKEFIYALEDWDDLGSFLEHVSLVMENDSKSTVESVTLMTLHAAKGSEFDIIFLPGWEEEIFPHRRALDEGGVSALEEERRLAYVGLTRARKKIFISSVANRRVYNQWYSSLPSRFLEELSSANLIHLSETGLTGEGKSGFSEKNSLDFSNIPSNDKIISKIDNSINKKLIVGMRVFHQKFGYGHIKSIEDNKLDIDFEKAGNKKVMSHFVEFPP